MVAILFRDAVVAVTCCEEEGERESSSLIFMVTNCCLVPVTCKHLADDDVTLELPPSQRVQFRCLVNAVRFYDVIVSL